MWEPPLLTMHGHCPTSPIIEQPSLGQLVSIPYYINVNGTYRNQFTTPEGNTTHELLCIVVSINRQTRQVALICPVYNEVFVASYNSWYLPEQVVNNAGLDVDFRIEGISEPSLFFVDASNNSVGIGTSAPTATLQVHGNFVVVDDNGVERFRVDATGITVPQGTVIKTTGAKEQTIEQVATNLKAPPTYIDLDFDEE